MTIDTAAGQTPAITPENAFTNRIYQAAQAQGYTVGQDQRGAVTTKWYLYRVGGGPGWEWRFTSKDALATHLGVQR